MADFNMHDLDLYELLGISSTCSVQEVKKAYRKKALTCHPDKNPDNPKAAELFHQLSKALEILIDEAARAAYDRVLKGKKAAKLRHRELDEKRKKLKEDLEAREKIAAENAANGKLDTRTDEEKLQAEIERLQKEGSQQVEQEVEFVRQQILKEAQASDPDRDSVVTVAGQNRLRIKWQASKDDPNNGGYPYETLLKILSKYGDIEALIVSPKKNGSALVEFKTKEATDTALNLEKGFVCNPLSIERLNADSTKSNSRDGGVKHSDIPKSEETVGAPNAKIFPSANSVTSTVGGSTLPNFPSAPDLSQLLYTNYLTGPQLRYPPSLSSVPSIPYSAQVLYPMMMPGAGVTSFGHIPQYRTFAGTPLSYSTTPSIYSRPFVAPANYTSSLQFMTGGSPLLAGSYTSVPNSRASYATGLPVFTGQVAAAYPSPAAPTVPSMATTAPMYFSQLLPGLPSVMPR